MNQLKPQFDRSDRFHHLRQKLAADCFYFHITTCMCMWCVRVNLLLAMAKLLLNLISGIYFETNPGQIVTRVTGGLQASLHVTHIHVHRVNKCCETTKLPFIVYYHLLSTLLHREGNYHCKKPKIIRLSYLFLTHDLFTQQMNIFHMFHMCTCYI